MRKGGPAPAPPLSSIWAQIKVIKNVGRGTRTQVVQLVRPAVHNLVVAGFDSLRCIFSAIRGVVSGKQFCEARLPIATAVSTKQLAHRHYKSRNHLYVTYGILISSNKRVSKQQSHDV